MRILKKLVSIPAVFILILTVTIVHGDNRNPAEKSATPIFTYFIVNKIPHDYQAFTQGLVFDNGYLYEGTGRHGQSSLRKVDPGSGAIIKIHPLDDEFFGEGITIFNNKIYQLTWQSYTGFVYDKDSFLFMEEFFYNTEGWGITHNNRHLIISDGTDKLYFLHPTTFEVLKQINVTDESGPVKNINELEYINGEIYANILSSYKIARINPENGKINSWIDLTGILSGERIDYAIDVLNGIAYDHSDKRLFVTGKYWPKIFEIRLIRKGND
jgi:glutamine cyclotransferase